MHCQCRLNDAEHFITNIQSILIVMNEGKLLILHLSTSSFLVSVHPQGFSCIFNFKVVFVFFLHFYIDLIKNFDTLVLDAGYVQVLMSAEQLAHPFQTSFFPILDVGVAD